MSNRESDRAEDSTRLTRRSVLAGAASASLTSLAGCSNASGKCINGGLKEEHMPECRRAGPLEYDGDIREITAKGNWMDDPVRWVQVTTAPTERVLTLDLFINGAPQSKELPPSPSETVTRFELCTDRLQTNGGVDIGCENGESEGEYMVQIRRESEVIDRRGFEFSVVQSACEHDTCFEITDIEVDNGA